MSSLSTGSNITSINVSTGLSQSVKYQYRVTGSDAINRFGPYSQYSMFTLDGKNEMVLISYVMYITSSTSCTTNYLYCCKQCRRLYYFYCLGGIILLIIT